MARAAVLPPSPAKRGTRTAPRSTLTKTTASSQAKAVAAPKRVTKTTTARKNTLAAAESDSDDTEDELGMMMQESETKPARPRGRPPGRTSSKTSATAASAAKAVTRPKKTASAPAPSRKTATRESSQPLEPTKKRVGRPKKSATSEISTAAKPETAPRARGRPKGSTTSKTLTTTRKNDRVVDETDSNFGNSSTQHVRVATNSATMRSNLLRGPAKKKTVTFREPNGAEDEGTEKEDSLSPSGVKQSKGTSEKTGLGAMPMRKAAGTSTRGRKPAVAKKTAGKPLSPKKDKQVTKSLASYVGSDGEEDELVSNKYNVTSPLKLVVDSPVRPGSGTMGLNSPMRRVNFTPQKPSGTVDENGEPKCSTPKNAPSGTGLSSPVRRINFTPTAARATVPDIDHQSLNPGKPVDFSDAVFMSSPARRPEVSPFQFSLRDTPNRGLLFRQDSQSTVEALTEREASPLKRSPRKANLGASFSETINCNPLLSPAKRSLIQSPPKRVPSPFKSSIQLSRAMDRTSSVDEDDDNETISLPSPRVETEKTNLKIHETGCSLATDDVQIVEDVARDIFGIELRCYGRSSSFSPLPRRLFALEEPLEIAPAENPQGKSEDVESDAEPAEIDQQIEELEDEIRGEPDDFGTVCLNTMEDLQEAFENLADDQGPQRHSEADGDFDTVESEAEEACNQESDLESTAQETNNNSLAMPASEEEPEESILELQDPETLGNSHIASPCIDVPGEDPATSLPSPGQERAHNETIVADQPEDFSDVESESGSYGEPLVHLSLPEATPLRSHAASVQSSPVSTRSTSTPSSLQNIQKQGVLSSGEEKAVQPENHVFYHHSEPEMILEESTLNVTDIESPLPALQARCESPNFNGKRQSLDNLGVGFTPLARKLDTWQASASTTSRLGKPHSPSPSEDVTYPDISRDVSEAESPLPPQSPQRSGVMNGSPLPQSPHTPPSARTPLDHSIMYSPIRLDIFEDSEMSDVDSPTIEADNTDRVSEKAGLPENHPRKSFGEDEDKENRHSPLNLPATPLHRGIDHLRTVHTVCKVPLKGEGEVSPLKLPRKRGHSLEARSPTRSSSRVRKPVVFLGSEPSPVLSPRKEARVPLSPSPKRRCSAPRRSSGADSVVQVPQSPSVASTAGRTPRRKSMTSSSGQALRGAVVYVDVHTTEGEDASGIFVELLQQMGARCFRSWSWNPRSSMSPVDGEEPKESKVGITHVVYKDGGLRTLEKVKYAGGLVKCVGVGWVLDCERENKWLEETPYMVDSSIVPRGGAKRRKSMEPRALSNVNGTLVRVAEPSTPSASGRRCGADQGAVEGFRKITPPTPLAGVPSTPTRSTERYTVPATPGYNFANLDAIGMSPATPYFLSNRAKLVQQSCPPKQSNRGLFDSADRPVFGLDADDEVESRRQQRARMDAARRKSHFYQPAIQSPLRE
ncbi:hypothetical protein POX_b02415 [Penicillium oxalicum]|uniref:hypothetical protein n=1 Tax=Penicillium oxalicum TaxID=69781 RepID=UPI0020B6E61B|nr:hypothetical protein POX_b02415 [Penicillium oxalicum]KAI2792378.1 hypothetical protein POX_b02415 [Penicillium oxalicum]